MVDVRQVVPGYHRFVLFNIPPDFIAQKPAARLRLEFETLLFEKVLFG
jgi:hypothetical protein